MPGPWLPTPPVNYFHYVRDTDLIAFPIPAGEWVDLTPEIPVSIIGKLQIVAVRQALTVQAFIDTHIATRLLQNDAIDLPIAAGLALGADEYTFLGGATFPAMLGEGDHVVKKQIRAQTPINIWCRPMTLAPFEYLIVDIMDS